MKITPLFIVLVLFLSACSSVKIVDVDKDPAFALSKYKTFGFHEIGVGGTGMNPDYQANLDLMKASITKQLEAKGLTHTQTGPELAVNIGVAVENRVQTRETSITNPGDRGMMYMGQRNYQWQSGEVAVGEYREGTVKIDLVDRSANKMVWTGTAESVLPNNAKNVPALIEEGMQKLFAQL
jgi:hypothetical protein